MKYLQPLFERFMGGRKDKGTNRSVSKSGSSSSMVDTDFIRDIQFSGEIIRINSTKNPLLSNILGEIKISEDGNLFLKTSQAQESLISNKFFFDSSPIYEGANISLLDQIPHQNLVKTKKEYHGDYVLVGKDASDIDIKAYLRDKDFKVAFSTDPNSDNGIEKEASSLRSLKAVEIGLYDILGYVKEINVFLSGCDIFRSFSIAIESINLELRFSRIEKYQKNNPAQVTTQLKIIRTDCSPER